MLWAWFAATCASPLNSDDLWAIRADVVVSHDGIRHALNFGVFCFQSKMTSTPVRAIFIDQPASEGYSLESLGKHGFGERLASQLECVSGGCFLTVGGPLTLQP